MLIGLIGNLSFKTTKEEIQKHFEPAAGMTLPALEWHCFANLILQASYHLYDFLRRKQHRLSLPSPGALHSLNFLPPLSFKLVLSFIIQSSKVGRSMSSSLLAVVDQVRIERRRFWKEISESADREREGPRGRKRLTVEREKMS